jgi:hypothetical protein
MDGVNELSQIAQYGAVGICLVVTIVLTYIIKLQLSTTDKYRDLFAQQFKQVTECLQVNASVLKGVTDVVSSDVAATQENTTVLRGLKEQLIKCNGK